MRYITATVNEIYSNDESEGIKDLEEGDVVVLVSAGIGYAWGATTIKWGKVDLDG